MANIAPADVLLFRYAPQYPAKHAAILTAPDRMVHAHDGACVAEVALADSLAISGHTRMSIKSNGPFGVAIEPRSKESWSRVRVVPPGFLFAMKYVQV